MRIKKFSENQKKQQRKSQMRKWLWEKFFHLIELQIRINLIYLLSYRDKLFYLSLNIVYID